MKVPNPYNMRLVTRFEPAKTIIVYDDYAAKKQHFSPYDESPIAYLTQSQLQAMSMLDAAAAPPEDAAYTPAVAELDGIGRLEVSKHGFREYRLATKMDTYEAEVSDDTH